MIKKQDDQRSGITRRDALVSIGAGLSALAAGCGSEPGAGGQMGPGMDPKGDPLEDPEPVLTKKELLAGIDTFVVLMMENRSFDHYFGSLRWDKAYALSAKVDGLSGKESNKDVRGADVGVFRLEKFEVADPPHGWEACHAQWNGGRNDGFVKEHAGPNEKEVMGYHERDQIPFFYALLDRYTLCERWFASVMGPTWPNRFYLHAATSEGKQGNTPFVLGGPDTVWERLRAKGRTCKNYYAGIVSWYVGGFAGKALVGNNPSVKIDEFFKDARAGTLPNFAIIDPDFQRNDDHPAHNIQLGQALIASIVKALAESPQWPRSLLLITYDEHGGFFDHVPPPTTFDPRPGFTQLGFRVPSVVIGPTVRRGHLSSTVLEHVSVPATLATRFDIQSLGPRMDRTADLSSCIDPRLVGKPAPPPTNLPKVMVPMSLMQGPGQGVSSQPELDQMVRSGRIPPHLMDLRSPEERLGSWLRFAQELEAIRVVR